MGGIGFCVWVPVRESLCLFWRETHTKGQRARFPTRPEAVEGRKVPEKVGRRGQSREGHIQQKRAAENSRLERAVKRRPVKR